MVFFMRGCGKGLDHTGFKIYDFLFDKTQTVFCQQRSISCLLIVAQRKHIFPIFVCYFAYENNCCHFRVFYFFYCSLIQCGGKKFACTQCSAAKDSESYFQEKYQLFFKLFVFGGSDLRQIFCQRMLMWIKTSRILLDFIGHQYSTLTKLVCSGVPLRGNIIKQRCVDFHAPILYNLVPEKIKTTRSS